MPLVHLKAPSCSIGKQRLFQPEQTFGAALFHQAVSL